jgi:drug/metabolite transporter (DMT)-like permease
MDAKDISTKALELFSKEPLLVLLFVAYGSIWYSALFMVNHDFYTASPLAVHISVCIMLSFYSLVYNAFINGLIPFLIKRELPMMPYLFLCVLKLCAMFAFCYYLRLQMIALIIADALLYIVPIYLIFLFKQIQTRLQQAKQTRQTPQAEESPSKNSSL